MKITWFAGMTFRVHIAGRIVVIDPDAAPGGIDAAELMSGAQMVVPATSGDLPVLDPAAWTPARRRRLIDTDEGGEALRFHRLGARGFVADSADEGVLVLEDAAAGPQWGRWADNAVVVLAGTGAACAGQGAALLAVARPKLIALAISDGQIDAAFERLALALGGAGLVVLESGMAVEV